MSTINERAREYSRMDGKVSSIRYKSYKRGAQDQKKIDDEEYTALANQVLLEMRRTICNDCVNPGCTSCHVINAVTTAQKALGVK